MQGLLRSLLFAPGNRPRMVEKVVTCGADAVILDLEDAVPIAEKEAARSAVRAALESYPVGTRAYVRINPLGQKTSFSQDLGRGDLEAVVCPRIAGVLLPKAETVTELLEVDTLLTRLEALHGMERNSVDLVPLIETALGVWNVKEIAESVPRVRRVSFGGGDFTRDIGVPWSKDETEVLYARCRVVVASRVARREQPLDTVWTDIQDPEGLRRSARLARQLGFQGKACIHPSQVTIVNEAFSPTDDEVAEAQRIVEAFAAAEAQGMASVTVDGRMIDYPVVEAARRVLALREALGGRGAG